MPPRPCLCLLCCQSMPFTLLSPSTEISGRMPAIKILLGNKHVALRSAGVGPVALLQDHNGISHVEMRKMSPAGSPVGCPPPGIPPLVTKGLWAPPGRKPDRSETTLEGGGAEVSPDLPDQHNAFPEYALEETLLPAPPQTLGTPPSATVSLGKRYQSQLIAACMPTPTLCQVLNRDGRPCSLYSACLYRELTDRRGLRGR